MRIRANSRRCQLLAGIAGGVLLAVAPALAAEVQQKPLSEDDLTQYLHQYAISQYPDREIDTVYALKKDGERVGYKVEYTPDSGKTVYFHPDGRRMASPPEE